jgi:chromosome segregation ATPase
LRDELESAKVKNAALEPRVETLNAELAEARADAKVARAESEYLRAAGDEARDRGASSDAERAAAEKHLAELKDVTRDLERKASEAEGRALALRSALDAAEKKTARLEKRLRLRCETSSVRRRRARGFVPAVAAGGSARDARGAERRVGVGAERALRRRRGRGGCVQPRGGA